MTMANTFIRRSVSLVALAAAVSLSSCQKEDLMEEQFAQPELAVSPLNGQAIDGQYIVVFKNGSSSTISTNSLSAVRTDAARIRASVIAEAGIASTEINQHFDGVVNGFAAKLSAEQLVKIRQNPDVAYVEQDRIITISNAVASGTDLDLFGKKSNNGKKDVKKDKKDKSNKGSGKGKPSEATPSTPEDPIPQPAPVEPTPVNPTPEPPKAAYAALTPLAGETIPWNIERVGYGDGTGKTVWIIDSGIDTDHSDLNVDLNKSFSFIYGNSSIEDGFGHGTTVAGIIAAKNNGSGMIGVAANATVVALRVFDDKGAGTVSRAISAVNYAINNAAAGDVVNMSLGSGVSSTLDNMVTSAASKGILFAIAAGNTGVDCSTVSPARVNADGVYTVSAIDSYNKLWASSNYGLGVDFAAPGVNVTSTNKNGSISGGSYGTSFAAPHVAGILLLRGEVLSQGTVTGDKDSTPDPIASLK